MSTRVWRVGVFCLLIVTGFLNAAVLLFLLGVFAGTHSLMLVPILGSLLLFGTSGAVLLWPRVGSISALVFLICIASWLLVPIGTGVGQQDVKTVWFFWALLALVALGIWFTSREALGFSRHAAPDTDSDAYFSISPVLSAVPPLLLAVYFGWLFATGAIRIGA